MNNDNMNKDSYTPEENVNVSSEAPTEEATLGTEINKLENDGDEQSAEKKRKFNILPKIICVLIAVIIWFYVMQVDSPDYEETFDDVPIVLTGTNVLENEKSLFVYEGYGYTVDITVNGKKSIISKYTVDDIKITADLSGINEAGEYDIALKTKLPSGLSFVKYDYDQINVYVDEKASVDVPIKAKITGANYNNEYEYGELVTEYNSVIVTGPKTALESIDNALASIDLSGLGVITETTSAVRPLTLMNKSGEKISNPYIKLSRSEVKVTLPVYTEKVVSLTVDSLNGYYNERNSIIKIQPSELRIKGDPSVLSEINSINVATLNEKLIEDNVTYTYELEESDKYIYLSNNVISVKVTHVNTVTKTFSVENIKVDAGENEYRLSQKSVDITLRGPEKQLEEITADDIAVIADVSSYSTDYSGVVSAEVDIVITKDGVTDVYDIGSYRVQIRVND